MQPAWAAEVDRGDSRLGSRGSTGNMGLATGAKVVSPQQGPSLVRLLLRHQPMLKSRRYLCLTVPSLFSAATGCASSTVPPLDVEPARSAQATTPDAPSMTGQPQAPAACEAPAPAAALNEVVLVLRNDTDGVLYLGGTEPPDSCQAQLYAQLYDGDEALIEEPSTCFTNCDDVIANRGVDCNALCDNTRAFKLTPGATHEVRWQALRSRRFELPDSCVVHGTGSCTVHEPLAAGTFRAEAFAYPAVSSCGWWESDAEDCDCNAQEGSTCEIANFVQLGGEPIVAEGTVTIGENNTTVLSFGAPELAP